MASASGKCINPKQSKSIYAEDWKWKKNPTLRNQQNDIYTPFRKRKMEETLMKYEKKMRKKNRKKSSQGSRRMIRSSSTFSRSSRKTPCCQEEGEEEMYEHYARPSYNSPNSIQNGRKKKRKKRPMTVNKSMRISRSLYGLAGPPIFDNNPTYNDVDSTCSEKTNILKSTLHGKRYGNYMNRPLKDLGKPVRPKVGRRPSRNFRKSKNIVVSKDLKEYYDNKYFKDSLYYDNRINEVPKRTGDNEVIEKLAKERKSILRSGNLYEGMMKLKRLNLLKKHGHRVRVSRHFPTKGYTYNDYHDKLTKDGYARNQLGTFFYR